MKVLISTPYLGGIGGIERAVWSVTKALSGHEIFIHANEIISGGLDWNEGAFRRIISRDEVYVRPWVLNKYLIPLRKKIGMPVLGDVDIHIHYYNYNLKYVSDMIRSRVTAIVPCGNFIKSLSGNELVMGEAGGNLRYSPDSKRYVTLPPPLICVSGCVDQVPGMPERFYLSVFNPYRTVKGVDVLYDVADKLEFPVVWCYSTVTHVGMNEFPDHRNIIKLRNVSQAQLRFLYQSCSAYISFSRDEGFGWAIADALLYGCPIVSRDVGILSFFPDTDGVDIYDSNESLLETLKIINYGRRKYDLSKFDPLRYESSLINLCNIR